MRVLLIAQEAPLDPNQVATGNALRLNQLNNALIAAGHQTQQVWLDTENPGSADAFDGTDALRGQLSRHQPEAILVSFWELLRLLPHDLEIPVILDFVAPRPLETLFEQPGALVSELRRLVANLGKCDLILVGNEQQAPLLTVPLLEAGFDLRTFDPVRVVPLAAESITGRQPDPQQAGWTMVSGGVDWPWRQSERYESQLHSLVDDAAGKITLVGFSGKYRLHEGDDAAPSTDKMMPFSEYSRFLAEKAHIGLELASDNIERRHSQSFRSLDFLRHGLPLICNQWLPMARHIEAYEAGWTVASPADLRPLLNSITADPQEWQRRRQNAIRLVNELLNPQRAALPLLDFLEAPQRATRLPQIDMPGQSPPILGKPDWKSRIARKYKLARRIILNRLMANPAREKDAGAIVIVSRSDLFPSDHGAAVKIVETARGLSRNGRVVLIVSDKRTHYWRVTDGDVEKVKLPLWLRLWARPLPLVKLDHYTRDIPESNAFLYLPLTDASFFRRTLFVASRHQASVLQAEFPAYAKPCIEVAETLGIKAVMVEHNVEYERLRTQVPELSDDQYERFRNIEINLANRCDAIICVSDNDRQKLLDDGVHAGLMHTVPHGIDLDSYALATAVDVRSKYNIDEHALIIAYHGTFAYPPNRRALQMLADEVLPRLQQRGLDAHVLAIGHEPPVHSLHPRIHCPGSVESMAPWLKAADMAVIPLLDGGGTRMKIIDCFAANLPVISTAKGIEGIPVLNGRDALVTDDWDDMANAICELANDPEKAHSIAAAGNAIAAELDWREIGRRYVQIFDSL